MKSIVHSLLRYRAIVIVLLAAWIAAGIYAFFRLDIEAYPDPSPPLVEFITQNPSWSAEEIERQVTIPVETALFGIPALQYTRSISLFGLSDVKLYFDYGTNYFRDRQEAMDRLQELTLPDNLQPQWSPWSPTGEIYRFRLEGPYSLNELKATEDWYVLRQLKQVPGIIDVTTFGGSTRQYQAEVDPNKLLEYDVTLPQVLNAINASNANVGGNYLTLGSQSVNVRGIGLLQTPEDMKEVIVSEHNGVPVFLSDVATVKEGYQPRLGRVGMDNHNDIVEGIVLLQRGEQSLPALRLLRRKIEQLNHGLLPPGMRIHTIYDRTNLIHVTTRTVREIVLEGLVLVTLLLLVLLGDVRIALIAALSIPVALLFAFALMVLSHQSANLISVGAIDFGILVDATVIDLEHIHRSLRSRRDDETVESVIAEAMSEASRPVLFSVAIILVAFLPLFTMRGVPGKIFSPMSITYGFALIGGRLFALIFAPVLASFGAEKARERGIGETALVRLLHRLYERMLPPLLRLRWMVIGVSCCLLALTLLLLPSLGGEFMPKLEEGNLWIRATLPVDVSFESASAIANQMRQLFHTFPVVTHVVSQVGRPDDGTDVTTFNNLEFFVQLKPESQWPRGLTKPKLVRQMNAKLQKFPGIAFGFSQNIEDNVEEAMSGVKGENSLKLFGDDINVLAEKAEEIRNVMAKVRGITDLGIFQETGQPDLTVSIDRRASARYGLAAADVNDAVQAAIGGQAATQILQGDRRFDFVVRYAPQFRDNPDAIRNILLSTPDGNRVPLGQVAKVQVRQGAFMIYRENGQRYIPIKFSVRGRDLASTIEEAQSRIHSSVHLPPGYHYEWAGEFDSLQKEERRLEVVIPITLVIILGLLYALFNSWRQALIVMAILPFGAIGGVFSLLVTGTPFSISAAVGFTSALGVGTLAASVFLTGIVRAEGRREAAQPEGGVIPPRQARLLAPVRRGALLEMRPIMLACFAALLGLLPASISTGIGAQAQQPLARVVVGAMITTSMAVLLLIPILASFGPRRATGAGD
jgi:cobalt-zinc-cadmium resistance protein CzcA